MSESFTSGSVRALGSFGSPVYSDSGAGVSRVEDGYSSL